MAKKNILITSPIKTHRNNFRYLDYGCLNLKHNITKENILIDHPWNKKKNYFKDTIKLNKIYLKVLRQLSYLLNDHHKVKKNLRYWKILIGPWLHSFIVMHYEKNLLINILLKYKKNISITVTNSKIENQIPDSFFTYFSKHVYSSSWNDYIFSQIILKKKLKKNFKLIKKKNNTKIRSNNKTPGLFEIIIKLILNIISKFFLVFAKKQSLIFFKTSLSLKKKLILIFKNFSLPLFINEKKRNILPDMFLRKTLSKIFKNSDEYDKEILKLSILNLPTDFLENFSYIGQAVLPSTASLLPKVLFTSNGIYPSPFETRYVAECISKGSKLIIAQHGGRYGNVRDFFHFNHELDISDYFLSWGKKKTNNKIKNFGIIKTVKSINQSNRNNQDILFLMVTKGRFSRTIDSEINVKELYNYYKNICPDFYFLLKKSLKKKLVYRSSKNNYWNEKDLLARKCQYCKIDFDRHKTDLYDAAKKSKIAVCSYLSTTFLELLYANIPVILFTPFSHQGYNSDTLKTFSFMEKSKIYFKSHSKAAKFLNENWEKIDEWWYSNKVQKSRKIFLKYFSRENPKLISDIQSLIETCKRS